MVLSVMTVGSPESPLAMMPSLPMPVKVLPVTLSRTHLNGDGGSKSGVDEQLAGLKKLAMIPLAPTFWIVLESFTENGVSRLLMPSLLALMIVVLATVNLKLVGTISGLAGMGALSSEIPVFA